MPLRLYTIQTSHTMRVISTSTSSFSVLSTASTSEPSYSHPYSETFYRVKWDVIALLVCRAHKVDGFQWNGHDSDNTTLTRYLCLDNLANTTLAVRVPLLSANGRTAEHDTAISRRLASEIATMQYIEKFTDIPAPRLWYYDPLFESEAAWPYIVTDRVEGVPLSSVWEVMKDNDRQAILAQVADIVLELWKNRFDKPGALFQRQEASGEGRDDWYVESEAIFADTSALAFRYGLFSTSYASAASYWLDYANAFLDDLENTLFGHPDRAFAYAQRWIIRSLIPALFDTKLDSCEFPFFHGDLSAQNIIVTNLEGSPQIAAVIGWDCSGPSFSSTFAQCPPFILGRDQTIFLALISERENVLADGLSLAQLISSSRGVYLFQNIMRNPEVYDDFYPQLFAQFFGRALDHEEDSEFETEFLWALMQKGSLKKQTERFSRDIIALEEARSVLGEAAIPIHMSASMFRALVESRIDYFSPDGAVMAWLKERRGPLGSEQSL